MSSNNFSRRNAKKWCAYCKIFIGSNEVDVRHHERGWRHKNNVQRYLKKQLSTGKKRQKTDNDHSKSSGTTDEEPEVKIKHDVGFYVIDGRPYLEAEYHQHLLRRKGILAEAVYPGTDDWLPVSISHKNSTHLNESISDKVLVIFKTRENNEILLPTSDVRLPVAPPPPPQVALMKTSVSPHLEGQNNNVDNEGLLFSKGKDTTTGLGLWKTTAIIESDVESETEVESSKVVRDSDDDTNDGVVAGVYRGVVLDDDNRNEANKNQAVQDRTGDGSMTKKTAKTVNYIVPESIKNVSTVFKKRKRKKERKKNVRKSVLG